MKKEQGYLSTQSEIEKIGFRMNNNSQCNDKLSTIRFCIPSLSNSHFWGVCCIHNPFSGYYGLSINDSFIFYCVCTRYKSLYNIHLPIWNMLIKHQNWLLHLKKTYWNIFHLAKIITHFQTLSCLYAYL